MWVCTFDLVPGEESDGDLVGNGTLKNSIQQRLFTRLRYDELARLLKSDIFLSAVVVEQVLATDTQFFFYRAAGVIETRVDNTAVSRAVDRARSGVAVDEDDLSACQRKIPRDTDTHRTATNQQHLCFDFLSCH